MSDSTRQPGRPDLEDGDFEKIRGLLRETTGISVSETKRHFVNRRLAQRVQAQGCQTYADYLSLLQAGDRDELERFTNAMTTNQTSFFREPHHFDYLRSTVLPAVERAKAGTTRRLRIWSAGCSTGQEPYSAAMVIRDSLAEVDTWDARILCTDLDSDVVRYGRAGVYTPKQIEGMSSLLLRRWFQRHRDGRVATYGVSPELRALTVFKQLNLLDPWPMRGPFDAIFCRNVFIYFERDVQLRMVERFADLLEEGGVLFLGHAESVLNASKRFELVGNTTYRRTG